MKKIRADLLRAVARGELGLTTSEKAIPRRGQRTAPLSYSQSRIWFIDQLEPGSSVYNVPSVLRLTGSLNQGVLQAAVSEIVRRHEALRTTFDFVEGAPIQRVHEAETVSLPVADLRDLAPEARAQQAQRLIHEETQRPFDLSTGPLFRAMLLRLGDEEHTLTLTMHHIVSDGWSRGILRRELSALYNAFLAGNPSPLPELQIQYTDYALWQRERLQGEELERQLSYWRTQLAGAPTLLDLPLDRPRPPVQTSRGASQRLAISANVSEALTALSQQEDATLFMTLLAAFQVLLSRHNGQDDIVIGTPIANRTRAEVEGLIGFFLNTLALRGDLSGDPSFREFLGRVREACLGAYAHQDLPFERLVEELQPERSLSHSPIFQVVFTFQNVPREALEFEGLRIERDGGGWESGKFDLRLSIVPNRSGFQVVLGYNPDLFDAEHMERMLEHYRNLLEGIAADPEQKLSRLPLLTEPERQQLLVEWNHTEADYPRDRCMHQLFQEQVERTPEAIAVAFEGRELTYRELNAQANRLAHALQRQGVGLETRIGVFLERSPEMIVALLAILKAGGAYLPLDPSYPIERLAFMLEDSRAPLLLTQQSLQGRLDGGQARVLLVDTEAAYAGESSANPQSAVLADNLAYVIYTSGSTGLPKGVEVSHRNLLNLVHWHVHTYALDASDRTTQVARSAFDASVWEIWPTLAVGASLHIAPEETILSPSQLLGWLNDQAISVSFLPTPLAEAVLAEAGCETLSLRALLTGGDRLHPVERHDLPFALINHYGPTESTVVATAGTVAMGKETLPPIGRPISNTQVYLLDGGMQPVPAGVAGELYLGGESLARGYLNRPELTAERFVPDPFSGRAGARLYRTGDLCRYLPDGSIEYLGRVDDQVKVRGFRIELGEIESVLSQHPGVREAAVLAREDGTQDKRLVAYVVSRNGAVHPNDLREHLRDKLPGYMIPSVFVALPSLPLSPNGKVDRKALPAPEAGEQRETYVAPRTPIEEGLAEIWCEILRVERVGIHANFFELGGHSLLATQAISRFRSTFQVELPLRTLFEAPTIALLAQKIAALPGSMADTAPQLQRAAREGRLPLSFAQQRLWFLDQFDPNKSVYTIPMALRLSGSLDIQALQSSFDALRQRHETLRTVFAMVDGEPCQVIQPYAPVALALTDLAALEPELRAHEAQRLIAQEAQRPFSLAEGPLFRASLLRLGEEEHILLLTLHHIISDGWSQGVLIRELTALYNAFAAGRPSPLPELPIQYADYAVWQRNWLQGEVLDRQIGYWKGQLRGAPTLLELPTDRPRPPVQTFQGARKRYEFSEPLSQSIKQLAQQEGVTLFMTLLTAFNVLLSRYSGQDDIVVGTPIANRTQSDLEGLIGFFLNTLAMRTDLSGDPSFQELLGRVRETALGAYAHQDLPFEKLVDELQPERSLSHSPLFQVMFIFQNAPAGTLNLDGLQWEALRTESVTAKYDLLLICSEVGGKLRASLEYNTDLFEGERIERLLDHFHALLEGIVADPEQQTSRLPLLSEAESHQLLVEFNATQAPIPPICLHHLIEQQVQRTPQGIAVVFEQQSLTYAELNARANQLAHFLRAQGVTPETCVGVCAERSIEMVVGLLGILKAGAAYLPLDPAYPYQRLEHMVQDARLSLVLTQHALKEKLPDALEHVFCLDTEWDHLQQQPGHNPDTEVTPDNLAYVIYTSGSTGKPKGAGNTHRGIVNRLLWMQHAYALTPQDRVLQKTPYSFDVSVWEFFWPLLTGARLVVAAPELHKDAAGLAELITSARITTLHFVPSMLGVFVEEAGVERCASVRQVFCSGEALPAPLVRAFHARLGARLHNLYGPTEAAVDVTYWECPRGVDLERVPIGRPVWNTQGYVLDARMQPVPQGVAGELYLGGVQVARGYLERADLTAEKFVPDPFSADSGARLYRTGDLCRWLADGTIEYLGRLDHQVKLRGFRIELGEIESALREHAAIKEGLVLAREDVPGQKRLVAYLVAHAEPVEASALRGYLLSRLPEYMVPSGYVWLEAFPLSANGKIDRKALPAPDAPERTEEWVAPRTPIEERLSAIFREVLRLEQVGIHDNFFELGGDSILSIQIISRANAAGLKLTPRQVFQHQTIAGLAAVAGTEAAVVGEQGTISGPVPLTPIQRWFFEQDLAEMHHFNQARLLMLDPRVRPEQIEAVVKALVAHHDALRLRFERTANGWQQTNAPEESNPVFDVRDLSSVDAAVQSAAINAVCSALQASLDMQSGPLLRAGYIHLGEGVPARLMLAIHHLGVDGVSWRVLLEDLRTGLEQ
ncbi:MAG TPA: amino acid adenylation domain-containing protein, partial [Chthonomonadaceae bacterium]|nr:amino acid adenylation domain-containing protein [Chthonomonadaceae bacterium]